MKPDDYVIATGKNHSVREFIDLAFNLLSLRYEIVDLHELSNDEADKKIDTFKEQKDKIFVVQHPKFYRPAEVEELLGNATKAKRVLGWDRRWLLKNLSRLMVEKRSRELVPYNNRYWPMNKK